MDITGIDSSTATLLLVAGLCIACLVFIIIILGVILLLRARRPKPPVYSPMVTPQPQWQPPPPGARPVYGHVPPANPPYAAPPGGYPERQPGGSTLVYGDLPRAGQPPAAPSGNNTVVYGDETPVQPPAPHQNPPADHTLTFTPPPPTTARLTMVSGSANLARLDLPNHAITIGRSSDCDLILNDPMSSRQHAIIEFSGVGWVLQDLNSQNGTVINNVRTSRETLHPGDQIRIGSTVLSFDNS